MSELFDKSIRTLELPRVLKLLADQAVSPEAKELALAVRPETDYEDVLRLLDQTDGARTMMILHGAPGFSGVKPIRKLLDRADRGGSLSISELIRVGDLLYAARRAKEYFNMDAMEPTAIDQIFLSIHGNRFLEDKIRRCIPLYGRLLRLLFYRVPVLVISLRRVVHKRTQQIVIIFIRHAHTS